MAYILLVEDDVHIRNFIIKGLSESGHTVEYSDNTNTASGKIETLDIDLAIVDIMLKGTTSGISMVQEWRTNKVHIPVLFLSARDRAEDKVEGFNAGGDDYLSKPFSFIELKARIENLLRRTGQRTKSNEYHYHDLHMNLLTREVSRSEKPIPLQRREFMLLEYFMENPELVIGKTMILERIWGFDFDPQTNVVDVLISRLRSKIDKDFSISLIHTIRGSGYVLKTT